MDLNFVIALLRSALHGRSLFLLQRHVLMLMYVFQCPPSQAVQQKTPADLQQNRKGAELKIHLNGNVPLLWY